MTYFYDYDLYRYPYQMSTGSTFISLLFWALIIVSFWFLFEKAGEPGWASVVPFYNTYELFKITWGNGWLFLLLLIPFANIIIGIITLVKLSKAFGKGGGWACGLIFLSFVFLPIMAFSKDIVYVGVPGKESSYNNYGQTGQQRSYQNPYNNQNYYQQSAQNPNYYYQNNSSQSKYCSNCGNLLENNEKFCPKCGRAQ